MAKTMVVEHGDGSEPDAEARRVPFLRGILTRSLRDAGLAFEEAYQLATLLRNELAELPEISSEQLRGRVMRHLERDFSPDVASRYRTRLASVAAVTVLGSKGRTQPFSRLKYRDSLEACGIGGEQADILSARIYAHLVRRGHAAVRSGWLGLFTYRYLRWAMGLHWAHRYLVWVDFKHQGYPLLLLIGGAPGTGKSTVANELAARLGIVRTQSTDMLREVLRMMLPERLLPVLHASSFNAWNSMPTRAVGASDPADLVAEGFMSQADLLRVPCEAVVRRALAERVSMILEGVHVHPSLLEQMEPDEDALAVPVMLAVLDPQDLRARFEGRGRSVPDRLAGRYLENFDAIWRLQSWLLAEADRCQVPIISSVDRDQTVRQIMGIVIDALSQYCRATPHSVFADGGRKS